MGKPSEKAKRNGRLSRLLLTIAWLLALPILPASAQSADLANWTYTYAYSGNLEADALYRDDQRLYYTQIGIDKYSHDATTPPISSSIPLDNIRDVTLHEIEHEIDVQVWGIRNLSVLVLHFNVDQRAMAERIMQTVQNLQYGGYLPMQNRAKIAVNNSSVAVSPVR